MAHIPPPIHYEEYAASLSQLTSWVDSLSQSAGPASPTEVKEILTAAMRLSLLSDMIEFGSIQDR